MTELRNEQKQLIKMNLKRLFFFSILGLYLIIQQTGCNNNDKGFPIITIDDAHYDLRAQRKDSLIPQQNYIIAATDVIIVDAAKYDYSKIRDLNNGYDPELIQIIYNHQTYLIQLDKTREIILDKSTLQNVGGIEPFNGFEKGGKALIGLGSLNQDSSSVTFKTFWYSFIEFE